MKHPKPVNLTTDDDLRKGGWFAAERDADGHLLSMISPDADAKSLGEFFAEARAAGNTAYTL